MIVSVSLRSPWKMCRLPVSSSISKNAHPDQQDKRVRKYGKDICVKWNKSGFCYLCQNTSGRLRWARRKQRITPCSPNGRRKMRSCDQGFAVCERPVFSPCDGEPECRIPCKPQLSYSVFSRTLWWEAECVLSYEGAVSHNTNDVLMIRAKLKSLEEHTSSHCHHESWEHTI